MITCTILLITAIVIFIANLSSGNSLESAWSAVEGFFLQIWEMILRFIESFRS